MTDNLEELERLLAKATRGPWIADKGEIRHPDGPEKWGLPGGPQERANCAAIVALHNAAPSLIAKAREADELRAENERFKAQIANLERAVIKAAAPDYMTEAERKALHDFITFLRSPEGDEARAALGEAK